MRWVRHSPVICQMHSYWHGKGKYQTTKNELFERLIGVIAEYELPLMMETALSKKASTPECGLGDTDQKKVIVDEIRVDRADLNGGRGRIAHHKVTEQGDRYTRTLHICETTRDLVDDVDGAKKIQERTVQREEIIETGHWYLFHNVLSLYSLHHLITSPDTVPGEAAVISGSGTFDPGNEEHTAAIMEYLRTYIRFGHKKAVQLYVGEETWAKWFSYLLYVAAQYQIRQTAAGLQPEKFFLIDGRKIADYLRDAEAVLERQHATDRASITPVEFTRILENIMDATVTHVYMTTEGTEFLESVRGLLQAARAHTPAVLDMDIYLGLQDRVELEIGAAAIGHFMFAVESAKTINLMLAEQQDHMLEMREPPGKSKGRGKPKKAEAAGTMTRLGGMLGRRRK